VSEVRHAPGTPDAAPSDALLRTVARLTPLGGAAGGLSNIPYRRAGALEVLAISLPMKTAGSDVTILVGRGRVDTSIDLQRADEHVARDLVGSFANALREL
jgi:hypothetical protein